MVHEEEVIRGTMPHPYNGLSQGTKKNQVTLCALLSNVHYILRNKSVAW